MRLIDTSSLAQLLPPNWDKRAKAALAKIKKARSAKARAAALAASASVWHDAKEVLAALSHDKCWYCQSEQIRSDNNVDHFRPKGRVAEAAGHGGYWWLAFEITNLRYSCTLCNSHRKDCVTGAGGGKQDHFPLFEEGPRAKKFGDSHSLERPLLLDPTVLTDPILLWFEPDGRAVEKADKKIAPELFRRAEVSIELYHLNESKLKTKRRNLCKRIEDLLNEGNNHYGDYIALIEAGRRGFASVIDRLRQMLRPNAEYTATAMAMLLANRRSKKYAWLEVVLSTL